MTRIRNGVARNAPKGAGLPPVLDVTRCACPTGPTPIATFRDQQLVEVELRHLRATGCGMRSRWMDPRDYLTELPRRRR